MDYRNGVSLADFTTFGIGGPAHVFARAERTEDVVEAVARVRREGWPLLVLGGGSNLLVSDAGFAGLVLQIGLEGLTATRNADDTVDLTAGAGESWDDLVAHAVGQGWAGVECLSGIPGTVGGTPVQNVGAYGQEVSDTIVRVRALERETGRVINLAAADCGFAYRASRFNTTEVGRHIILEVTYRLTPGGAPHVDYRDLKERFRAAAAPPDLSAVRRVVRDIRHTKGMLLVPGESDCRSAGSFFKNPIAPESQVPALAETAGSTPPVFPFGPGRVKVPAAWLIENSGFPRGYGRGAAAISSRHTLALVNRGGARAQDILDLAREIRDRVRERFGLELRTEPVLVGFVEVEVEGFV